MAAVPIGPGDFELTMDELRAVARYAAASAQEVLPLFEESHPGDSRPRAAVEAALVFAGGAPRTKLQRTASLDAHRAARDAADGAARHAARSAADAAAAAYLHPLARATQVGHILGAAAHAARAAELRAGDDPSAGHAVLRQARQRAAPAVVGVLGRYPPAPAGKNRVALLMRALDDALRAP